MRHLLEFWRLPAPRRRLFIAAYLLLGAVGLGLRLLPFRVVRGLLERGAGPPAGTARAPQRDPEAIGWAVATAGRLLPGLASCLAEALTAMVLLGRQGHPAMLRIGVTRAGPAAPLQAHAWLECQGGVLVGDRELDRYRPLPPLPKAGA